MEFDMLLAVLSVGAAIAGAFWLIIGKLNSLEDNSKRFEEKVIHRFQDYKEDHHDHHREITKMFDMVSDELREHITQTKIDHQELLHKTDKVMLDKK